MGLNNTNGNMYPWVSHTWNPIAGECKHDCSYCYMKKSFLGRLKKYEGDVRLSKNELKTDLGEDRTIFVGSATDVFGHWVPSKIISTILNYCNKYPNTYLYQSKNPKRFAEFLDIIPKNNILATTLETNRDYLISQAPKTYQRFQDFVILDHPRKMISIEPVLDFDLEKILSWIRKINPEFVSIGADSKNNELYEPPSETINMLIKEIKKFSVVKVKKNLHRIL
ncbi:MAG: DUF5131 family protein [Thermoplasmatales archaeon]|nr:MAG: DUF5131 family protein [Thermoplasmatales archaeon]